MTAVGIVFSNIHDNNVPELSRHRTMASIPFGGRYRLIDFVLSNFVNSGITTVGIITKNNYQSLMDHIESGKAWDLARKSGGLVLLPPFGDGNETLYGTRLEALKGITGFLSRRTEDYVVLSDCDGVMRINFDEIIDFHEEKNADITMVYNYGEVVKSPYYLTVSTNLDNRIDDISLNANIEGKANVYINVMVINRLFLLNTIYDAISHGYKSFGKDILINNVKSLRIYGYEFKGYYAGINSLVDYYRHNMELLDKNVRNELFGARDIYTKVKDSAPTKYGDDAIVKNSLISDGCVVEGIVENSILFRGVKVGRGSVVKNSIVLQDNVIGDNATINCVITDKNVVIRDRRNLSGCDIRPFYIPKGSLV